MITILELINFFKKSDNNSELLSFNNFTLTNFSYNDSLNSLLFCLMYAKIISGFNDSLILNEDNFDRKIIDLNSDLIKQNKLNLIVQLNLYEVPFFKKKIINLINNNQYNHEIILFIAGIYEVNIFVYFKDINIIKLYYPENEFNKNKKNVYLQYNKDIYTSNYGFQIMNETTNLNIDDYINYIYPIGFTENKKFIINKNNEIFTFVLNNNNTSNLIKNFLYDNKIIDIKFYNKILNCIYVV